MHMGLGQLTVYPCVKMALDNTHQLTDRSHINFCVIVKSRLLQKTIKRCLYLPVCTLL